MIRPLRITWHAVAADLAELVARREFCNRLARRGAIVSVAGLVWTLRWPR